jgi:hypothetical protein
MYALVWFDVEMSSSLNIGYLQGRQKLLIHLVANISIKTLMTLPHH